MTRRGRPPESERLDAGKNRPGLAGDALSTGSVTRIRILGLCAVCAKQIKFLKSGLGKIGQLDSIKHGLDPFGRRRLGDAKNRTNFQVGRPRDPIAVQLEQVQPTRTFAQFAPRYANQRVARLYHVCPLTPGRLRVIGRCAVRGTASLRAWLDDLEFRKGDDDLLANPRFSWTELRIGVADVLPFVRASVASLRNRPQGVTRTNRVNKRTRRIP